MSGNTSKVGQRVDQIAVDDEPHEKYYDSGVPILLNTAVGQVVSKSVHAYTVHCSQCNIPARFNEKSEPVCPECGLICAGEGATSQERVVCDPKAAGRVDTDGAEAQA